MKKMFFTILILFLNFFPIQFLSAKTQNKVTPYHIQVCILLDKAGKNDHGFNESAYLAYNQARQESLIASNSKIFDAKDDVQTEQALRTFVNIGCGAIISVGINNAEIVKKMAPLFPQGHFIVIDSIINEPNVRSITFQDNEGAFMMGVIAASNSSTGTIGFVGGMDIPLIKRFLVAYEAGAKYINPKIRIKTAFVGTTIDAWNNPSKAKEIAQFQIEQGADIIFQAAGASGLGVFDAVELVNTPSRFAHKVYAIGCDSNQNWVKPKLILTSMIKDVGHSIIETIIDLNKSHFTAGVRNYNLENNGIAWAYDKYNETLFNTKEVEKINKIKALIVSKKIDVPDYQLETKY